MIKINLLPHAKRAKASDTEKFILLYLVLLAIICMGIAGTTFWYNGRINSLEEVVQEKETQRQLLLARVGRINQLQRQFEEIESNIRAIKEIRLSQQLPVRYVHEAARFLPEEKIWFEALNLDRGGRMDIRGVALDNQAFARYIDELRTSDFIRSVSTQRTSRRQIQNLDLVEFQFQVRAGPAVTVNQVPDDEN